MGFIMSVLTSLAVTIVNIGIIPNFLQKWFDIFLTTFAIGFPITIAIIPPIHMPGNNHTKLPGNT
jgi:hypothetical protein